MKILLNRYHPICDDLANSFANHLKFDVSVSIDTKLNDHYGSHLEILKKNQKKYSNFKTISINEALPKISLKQFDLIFVDGVFGYDKQIIQICKDKNIPYVCINGYPYNKDEDAKNILSFSWFLPQMQFAAQFPSEGFIKSNSLDEVRKNVLVWYPELSEIKAYARANPRLLSAANKNGFITSIHRFEECNPRHFSHFQNIEAKLNQKIENCTNLTSEDWWLKLNQARGFVHLKPGDCPGISLLEAMNLGAVPFIMEQFILASFNQEVLIDNYSAVISNSDEEFVENLQSDKWAKLSEATQRHAHMITDFKRQQEKLEKFIQKCLK